MKYVTKGILPMTSETEDEYRKNKANMKSKGDRIPMAGFLDKQGHVNKNWKRRWFVLPDSRLTAAITYYADDLVIYTVFLSTYSLYRKKATFNCEVVKWRNQV